MLTFAGVGPGDPELVTIKAARLLREADAVAVPDAGTGKSAVLGIVGALAAGKPLLRLKMPMRGDREDWRAAHETAAEALLCWLERYPHIVYPVLGDPSIYASSSYLMRLVSPRHPCAVVPGIPAMCAAAAALGVPLCEQRESLTVVDELPEGPLPAGGVAVMKGGKKLPEIRAAAAGREAWAVRNLGMEDQWIGPLSLLPEDGYSYFTTVLIRPVKG